MHSSCMLSVYHFNIIHCMHFELNSKRNCVCSNYFKLICNNISIYMRLKKGNAFPTYIRHTAVNLHVGGLVK
jgi:hypothetical protein